MPRKWLRTTCVVFVETTPSLQNCALVYSTSLTVEFLTVFTDNLFKTCHFSCPQNARYYNKQVFKVLSFSFDKGLLAPLVYRFVNNGLFKVSP